MTYEPTDWHFYLTPDELERVQTVEKQVDALEEKRKELSLSIHFTRNAACQRRRYAIGPVRKERSNATGA